MSVYVLSSVIGFVLLMFIMNFRAWDMALLLWLFGNALAAPVLGAMPAAVAVALFVAYSMVLVVALSRRTA